MSHTDNPVNTSFVTFVKSTDYAENSCPRGIEDSKWQEPGATLGAGSGAKVC